MHVALPMHRHASMPMPTRMHALEDAHHAPQSAPCGGTAPTHAYGQSERTAAPVPAGARRRKGGTHSGDAEVLRRFGARPRPAKQMLALMHAQSHEELMQVQPTYIPGWVRFAWQRHAPLALAALLRLGLLLRPHAAVLQPTCCRHSVSGADASLWQACCVMLPPLPSDVFT